GVSLPDTRFPGVGILPVVTFETSGVMEPVCPDCCTDTSFLRGIRTLNDITSPSQNLIILTVVKYRQLISFYDEKFEILTSFIYFYFRPDAGFFTAQNDPGDFRRPVARCGREKMCVQSDMHGGGFISVPAMTGRVRDVAKFLSNEPQASLCCCSCHRFCCQP